MGDTDSGPTCLKFYDRPAIHYQTYAECAVRLRELIDAIKDNPKWLEIVLPGDKRYRGHCYIPVIDEVAT